MKVEGSSQSLQCEVEAPTQQPVKPIASVDRVEQARVEERVYAGDRSFAEEKLYALLSSVPTPGALELELSGKLNHSGGKAKVTAERDASGEFVIRVEGQAQAALAAAVVAAEVGPHAALTYRVRTPEAAADLLHSLVVTAPGEGKVAHYGAQNLERVELSLELGASVHGLLFAYGAADLSTKGTAYVDFNEHLLVTEQAVEGELLGRASVLLVRAGLEGEFSIKMRTEVELPDEVLSKVASGELSPAGLLQASEVTRKFVVESERRAEVHTLFAPGYSKVKKVEAELDLDQLFSNPTQPGLALKGSVKTMTADLKAVGVGFDLPGFHVLARGAIYEVREEHLFQPHTEGALQKELDIQRSLHPR